MIFFYSLAKRRNMLTFMIFCSKSRHYDAKNIKVLIFFLRITSLYIVQKYRKFTFSVQNTHTSRQKNVMLILKSQSKSITLWISLYLYRVYAKELIIYYYYLNSGRSAERIYDSLDFVFPKSWRHEPVYAVMVHMPFGRESLISNENTI